MANRSLRKPRTPSRTSTLASRGLMLGTCPSTLEELVSTWISLCLLDVLVSLPSSPMYTAMVAYFFPTSPAWSVGSFGVHWPSRSKNATPLFRTSQPAGRQASWGRFRSKSTANQLFPYPFHAFCSHITRFILCLASQAGWVPSGISSEWMRIHHEVVRDYVLQAMMLLSGSPHLPLPLGNLKTLFYYW